MKLLKCLSALVVMTAAAAAQAGPLSTLYLTYTGVDSYTGIATVQGNTTSSLTSWAYQGGNYEIPIAVYGDIRTTGYFGGQPGGQYTLGGTATGVSYTNPGFQAYDGTTDGTYNYVVDYRTGDVIRTDRDYQNPVVLFNVGTGHLGITYDPTNHSLWISDWASTDTVANYSMSGALLSSFGSGHTVNGALALDHADGTLWLVDNNTNVLEQFSKAGAFLGSSPYVGYTLGGEFELVLSTVPEPSALLLAGGTLLMLRRRRR